MKILGLLRRIVQPNPTIPTRFHTQRGLVPWTVMPGIIRAIYWRLRPPRMEPWLAPPAIKILQAALRPDARVLEFGGGRSTVWFARQGARVTCLESEPDWAREISAGLEEHADRVEVTTLPLQSFHDHAAKHFAPGSMDVAVVDCMEPFPGYRLECLRVARDLVRPGGLLVLDNSDRPEYAGADTILAGWPMQRYVGFPRFPLHALETTIYTRPG